MTLHHAKHRQTYINNLNVALASQATVFSKSGIVAQLHLQEAVRFNAGGHINHTLFWGNLTPPSSPSSQSALAPNLISVINGRWDSLEKVQEKLNSALLGLKGSGWGWLVEDIESNTLEIAMSKD